MGTAILYKANETQFNHLGLGPLNDAISILVTEERNGIFELEMKYPVSGKVFHELKNDRIIKADAGHKLKDQRFKIIRITKPLKGVVTVYAEHVSYLTQDLALKPKVTFSGNARQALEHWKANLVDDNPFTVWSDISTTGKINWTIDEVENARRALGGVRGSILDVYGGEYLFDNYDIYLYQKRGVNSELLIAYGRNLVDLEQEEEIANTYTSIYPYSIYTDDDGNERMVTLPEYYIDSEHVDKYARRKILVVDFTTEEIKTVSALRSATRRYIKDNDVGVPKVNLKIQYVDLAKTLDYKHQALLEEVNLCDNVMIYFEKYDINTTAKVIKVVWDVLNERYDSIEVGEARASLSQAIDTVVDGKVNNVEKLAMQTLRTADGKNTIYFGLEEPSATEYDLKKNDIWYRIVDGEFTRTYRYDGVTWQLIIDMDSQEAKQEAQQAKERAQQAVDRANQATQQATDAINQAQASFDLAQDALSKSTALEGDVTNLSTMVNEHTGEISTIKQSTTGLQTTVSELRGDFDGLEYENRNLLPNNDIVDGWSSNRFNEVFSYHYTTNVQSTTGAFIYKRFDLEGNHIFQIQVKTNDENLLGKTIIWQSGGKDVSEKPITLSEDWQTLISIPIEGENVAVGLRIVEGAGGELLSRYLKLEKGTKATPWSPAPEDIDRNFSEITQKIDSITTRVGDAEGNLSTLQQTSTSLAGRISDAEGNLTTLTATVDGLQTTVSDIDGNVSNLTQLSNTLQTRLSDAEGNINTLTQTVDSTVSRISSLANPNLIKHDPSEWERISGIFMSPKGFIFGERYDIEPNKTYTITNYSVNGELVIALSGVTYREITLSKGESITFTTGTDEKYYAIFVPDADPDFLKKLGTEYRFKLEEGTESTAWTAHDEDIYSQYSQLKDAINLRVAKGDVINQINLDTSGVLISGKKLILDGDTTVTGDFKVGNANITSIDAGKITVGDLVGHSLVGGSVIGGYIEQQSGGNRVEIHNGTISHYRYGELKSTMDGLGHNFYQTGSYIGHIGTSTWINDSSYKGLAFNLENDADYMTWAHRKTANASTYTTMLAWHKTSNKDNKGFTFYDNVHISHDNNLYVRRILTTGYASGRKAVELQNYNWNNNDGVFLTRAPNRGDTTAGLFLTSRRAVLIDGGNANIEVGNDSTGNYVKSIDIWNRTSSNSSNVRVSSSGKLYRTSSASKYKLLIENEEKKGYNYNNILNLSIKSWYDKLEAETLYDLTTNDLTDYEDEEEFYLRRHFGLVAEDLEEAGLKEFIDYNDETGEIEGIQYDRLWTLLIPITRQHRDDIDWLKLENQYLRQKIKILEEKVV